jgi:hypothetical protein
VNRAILPAFPIKDSHFSGMPAGLPMMDNRVD